MSVVYCHRCGAFPTEQDTYSGQGEAIAFAGKRGRCVECGRGICDRHISVDIGADNLTGFWLKVYCVECRQKIKRREKISRMIRAGVIILCLVVWLSSIYHPSQIYDIDW